MEEVGHPYHPLGMKVVGYQANERDSITLVSIFASGCAIIFFAAYLIAMKVHPKISRSDLWTIMWFILCQRVEQSLDLEKY